jgi:hypothetical protein
MLLFFEKNKILVEDFKFEKRISISLRPESSENIPILLQMADLCFSKQNVIRNPKMGSKQSVIGAPQ